MPDKHEVGGSSPLGPTSRKAAKMLIENRIKERNETDSCMRKTFKRLKVFP